MSLISVIVPTYNRAGLIQTCYDSVVAQKHRPLEFLVGDDCSTDNTAEVVRCLPALEGVTVRYLRLPSNKGASGARNVAIKAAAGDLVAFLDSDDVWFPDHLEKLLHALATSDADVVFSRAAIRESLDSPPSGRSDFGPLPWERENIPEGLFYYNFVLPSVTLVRRGFFDKVGLFEETARVQHEDWDIFLRAAQAGLKFAHVPETTAWYVVPASVPEAKTLMYMRRTLGCLEKHYHYPLTPAPRRRFTLGYYRASLGMRLGAENAEARGLFLSVLGAGWWHPLLGPAGLSGLLVSCSPAALRPLGRRLLARLFRRVRAHHRAMRGFPDPWD